MCGSVVVYSSNFRHRLSCWRTSQRSVWTGWGQLHPPLTVGANKCHAVCLPRSVRVLSQLRAICVLLLLKDCMSNSQHAVNWAVLFQEFVASDLAFCSPCSSPGPRRTPAADDSLVRVQRVCRTFSHHTGQSVQTHEPALHSSAAGETPTQRRHRLYHGYRLSANKPEVTPDVTLGFFSAKCCLCFTVP